MASTINASTSSGIVQTADTSGVLQLQTASTTAVTVDASQNVGIGTTSAGGKLGIVTSTTATALNCNNALDTGFQVNFVSGLTSIGNNFNNPLAFLTSNTERMRIDSSGNVLVGTTTNTTNTKATFSYDGSSVNGMGIIDSTGTTAGTRYIMLFQRGTGTTVGSISTTTSTTAFNTSSDYRLKDNIVPMTGALDKVLQLKPVTYKWKLDGSNGQGFIAHELQAVVPDCVTGEKDAVDEEGNIKPQGVDTSFLVATLTAAIQEQQTIINDLKARITALESATSQAPVANTGGTV
jgi:hypothetical protein